MILDNMIAAKQLKEEERDRVHEVLLSRHRHQHDKHHHGSSKGLPIIRSLAEIGRKASDRKIEGGKGKNNLTLLFYSRCHILTPNVVSL